LFALHNEHCVALPRIWNHLVLVATGGNYKALLFLNAGMGFALLALLVWHVRDWNLPLPIFLVLNLGLALAVSSWAQWQNLLWGFQAPFFMLPLFLAAAAILLARCRNDAAAFSVANGVVWLAVFTNGNGIFVGWALLPCVLLRRSAGAVWRNMYFANLALATAVAGWLLSSRPLSGGIEKILARPFEAMLAGLSVLGSPFVPAEVFFGKNQLAALIGFLSLGFGLFLVVAFRAALGSRRSVGAGPGIALAAYGLLSVAAVVYGRSDLLLTAPIESRYQSFALWWVVGLILCSTSISSGSTGRWRVATTALTSLAAVGLSLGILAAMPLFLAHGKNMRSALTDHQEILRNAWTPGREGELGKITAWRAAPGQEDPERLRNTLARMREAGILHADLQPVSASTAE
jgi:hypothetical protein